MSISEKITQYRKMRGLTQETLGEALGITAQAISKWEIGSTMPDISLLPRLCELLDVPPDVLLEIPQDLSVRYLMKTVSALGREHYSEHRGVDMTSLLLDIVGRTIGNDGHNYDGNNLHIGDEFIRLRLQRRDSSEGNESENECKRMDEAAFLLCGAGTDEGVRAADGPFFIDNQKISPILNDQSWFFAGFRQLLMRGRDLNRRWNIEVAYPGCEMPLSAGEGSITGPPQSVPAFLLPVFRKTVSHQLAEQA